MAIFLLANTTAVTFANINVFCMLFCINPFFCMLCTEEKQIFMVAYKDNTHTHTHFHYHQIQFLKFVNTVNRVVVIHISYHSLLTLDKFTGQNMISPVSTILSQEDGKWGIQASSPSPQFSVFKRLHVCTLMIASNNPAVSYFYDDCNFSNIFQSHYYDLELAGEAIHHFEVYNRSTSLLISGIPKYFLIRGALLLP